MKAIVVEQPGGPERLVYKETELPRMNENQVLIKTKATSINYADIKMRNGSYPGNIQYPFTPGLDVSGIVMKTGANVQHIKEDQHVIAFPAKGTYAEYVAADAMLTFPIPEHIDFKDAAAFPIAGFVAYELLHQAARIKKGESLLVHAASGGVGTTVIQLARLAECEKIIAVTGSEHKKEWVKDIGAHKAINYKEEDVEDRVLTFTDGKGVDVILDSIGGDMFYKNIRCLAPFGRLVYFGNTDQKKAQLDISELYPSGRSVIGYSFGSIRKKKPEHIKNTAANVLPLLSDSKIKMKVSKTFPLEEAEQAHQWMESRESTGKTLLIP